MYRVTREICFCYGHRLLNYDGKCRHLHGHNGRAVIVLETTHLDPLGMVVDFSRIKRVVGAWINETLDHRMLLPAQSKQILLHEDGPNVRVTYRERYWSFPRDECAFRTATTSRHRSRYASAGRWRAAAARGDRYSARPASARP